MVVVSTLLGNDVVVSDDILVVWDVVVTLVDVVVTTPVDVVGTLVDVEVDKDTAALGKVAVVNLVDVVGTPVDVAASTGGFGIRRISLSSSATCEKALTEATMTSPGSITVVTVDDGVANAKFEKELFL